MDCKRTAYQRRMIRCSMSRRRHPMPRLHGFHRPTLDPGKLGNLFLCDPLVIFLVCPRHCSLITFCNLTAQLKPLRVGPSAARYQQPLSPQRRGHLHIITNWMKRHSFAVRTHSRQELFFGFCQRNRSVCFQPNDPHRFAPILTCPIPPNIPLFQRTVCGGEYH